MDMSNEVKDTLIVSSGVINAVLPSWVSLVPQYMSGIESVLRIVVALATVIFLVERTLYYRKRSKKLDTYKDNERDDD